MQGRPRSGLGKIRTPKTSDLYAADPEEFRACQVPYAERGPRTDEAMAVLRTLWSGEEVSVDGNRALTDGTVTLRDRDTLKQWRVHENDLVAELRQRIG